MSNCGVCLCGGDYGDNDFYMESRTIKSKAQCCECGNAIPAGQVHEHASFNDEDGKRYHMKSCGVCAEIAWAFFCDGGRVYGQLWEYMEDVILDSNYACFDRLKTPQAKAELQRRWMKAKGLVA